LFDYPAQKISLLLHLVQYRLRYGLAVVLGAGHYLIEFKDPRRCLAESAIAACGCVHIDPPKRNKERISNEKRKEKEKAPLRKKKFHFSLTAGFAGDKKEMALPPIFSFSSPARRQVKEEIGKRAVCFTSCETGIKHVFERAVILNILIFCSQCKIFFGPGRLGRVAEIIV
jgi:hypothetical protein